MLKNGLFIEHFNTVYKEKSTAHYIIPFHYSSLLQTFGKKRNPTEMDILVYLNRDQFVKSNDIKQRTDKHNGFSRHTL